MIETKYGTYQFIIDNIFLDEYDEDKAFLIKGINVDTKLDIYGVLIISIDNTLDDHCEQCFNEEVLWFRFRGDEKLCEKYLIGQIGLKKYEYFKDNLNKILGSNVEIINQIK